MHVRIFESLQLEGLYVGDLLYSAKNPYESPREVIECSIFQTCLMIGPFFSRSSSRDESSNKHTLKTMQWKVGLYSLYPPNVIIDPSPSERFYHIIL